MDVQAAYDELIRRSREVALLSSCETLLGWDELTYLPRGGAEYRSQQMAYLAGLQHERSTDPRLGELLGILEGSPLVTDPLAPAAVNIREIRRSFDRLSRLPRALVEELARTATLSDQAWALAREAADFVPFLPWLERILDLKRQEAECLGYQSEAYDALLQEYEPEATGRALAHLFAMLQQELTPLVDALTAVPRQPNVTILKRAYGLARQRAFCERVARRVGFDFQRGRLDTAVHPFCSTIGPGDCRITTRYRRDDFGEAFFGTLHEVGHALYEQGFGPEHAGTPMGEANSVGVHESQSRLWENLVGRSRAFWIYFFPLAQRAFRGVLDDVNVDDFHFAVNHVAPSLNRIRADEVTYNLHILARFELERALVSGNLAPADLAAAWTETYRRYLGVVPANDAEGCLQDGHWASGMFGYFPTYTLGNLFAAQIYAAAMRDLGEPESAFALGEFGDLLGWLRSRVHQHGSRYSAASLIAQATGSAPDVRPLVQGLRRKYSELYGL
jgi:carboxypeptidase Taq